MKREITWLVGGIMVWFTVSLVADMAGIVANDPWKPKAIPIEEYEQRY